jgi:hypothetical protein
VTVVAVILAKQETLLTVDGHLPCFEPFAVIAMVNDPLEKLLALLLREEHLLPVMPVFVEKTVDGFWIFSLLFADSDLFHQPYHRIPFGTSQVIIFTPGKKRLTEGRLIPYGTGDYG